MYFNIIIRLFNTEVVIALIDNHGTSIFCHFRGGPPWSNWQRIGQQITTTRVRTSAWAYPKGVSSVTFGGRSAHLAYCVPKKVAIKASIVNLCHFRMKLFLFMLLCTDCDFSLFYIIHLEIKPHSSFTRMPFSHLPHIRQVSHLNQYQTSDVNTY